MFWRIQLMQNSNFGPKKANHIIFALFMIRHSWTPKIWCTISTQISFYWKKKNTIVELIASSLHLKSSSFFRGELRRWFCGYNPCPNLSILIGNSFIILSCLGEVIKLLKSKITFNEKSWLISDHWTTSHLVY